jgi:hypothetical protein
VNIHVSFLIYFSGIASGFYFGESDSEICMVGK